MLQVQVTFVPCSANRAHDNCVEAEQKNAKQNRSLLERLLTIRKEYQNFLEGKFDVGVASVVCIVSHRCPIFIIFGKSVSDRRFPSISYTLICIS